MEKDVKAKPWANIGSGHQSLNSVITDALRQAIFQGDFKPGERLVESRLAEMFQVSRNPIREALKALAAEGIVEISMRKGARVPTLSDAQIAEIIELRAELESVSAKFAARRCTEDMHLFLSELLEEGNKAEKDKDTERLIELNAEFHLSLANASQNRYLSSFMRSIHERTSWLLRKEDEQYASDSWREHASILEAVLAAEPELAAVLAKKHVREAGKTISDFQEKDD